MRGRDRGWGRARPTGRRSRVGVGCCWLRLGRARDPGQDEALPRHHPGAKIRQRIRLHRPIGRGADLEPLERARYELVDPGQGLLPGQLVGEAALGDRTLHGAAQEHDDAVLHGDHDPERGDVLRHVADDPGSQTGRDHGGGQLAVRGDGGRQFEELAGRLRSAPPAAAGPSRRIRTTVSPNRPTSPLPGSIPIREAICSMTLPSPRPPTARSAMRRRAALYENYPFRHLPAADRRPAGAR